MTIPLAAQTGGERDPGRTTETEHIPLIDTLARDGGFTALATAAANTRALTLPEINSSDRDNTPIISADGKVMFFNSTRHAGRSWARRMSKERYDDDSYFTTQLPRSPEQSLVGDENIVMEEWSAPVNLVSINTAEDDGIATMNPSGNLIYFLSMKSGWENNGGPFYDAKLNGTEVTDVKGLGGGITRFFANVKQRATIRIYGASVGPHARSFYFATTVNSTTGDHEVWVSQRGSNEEPWGYPQNLGPSINAGGGSYAPFIAADDKTLYFASGRPGGLGGDDIYMTVREENGWRAPANLGSPINSPGTDGFLSIPASGERVYFSSSRDGNDDIYVASLRPEFRPTGVALLTGTILDKNSNEAIEATITIEDLATGRKIYDARSSAGDGRYTTVLTPGGRYGISVSAPGYVFVSENYAVPEGNLYSEITRDYRLERPQANQRFTLENIFFDYRSASLRAESDLELARLGEFLRTTPGARIEVGGHTDSLGSPEFNRELSEERARVVRQHLVEKLGVDGSRIESRGYGSSKPVQPNASEEGRQKNRRVEFTILTTGKE